MVVRPQKREFVEMLRVILLCLDFLITNIERELLQVVVHVSSLLVLACVLVSVLM